MGEVVVGTSKGTEVLAYCCCLLFWLIIVGAAGPNQERSEPQGDWTCCLKIFCVSVLIIAQ